MNSKPSLIILSVALLVATVQADNVRFVDCGSVSGTIESIDVSPCRGAPRGCALKKGTQPEITIKFTANKATTNITAKVAGIISGVEMPFPLPNPNGCLNSGLTCPLVATQKETYTQSLEVKPEYPKIRVIIKWRLIDDTNKNMVCFKIQGRVLS